MLVGIGGNEPALFVLPGTECMGLALLGPIAQSENIGIDETFGELLIKSCTNFDGNEPVGGPLPFSGPEKVGGRPANVVVSGAGWFCFLKGSC